MRPPETPALAEPTNKVASHVWKALFALAVSAFALLVVIKAFFIHQVAGDHYLYLAHHLVRGELVVDGIPMDYPDYVEWQGHQYLPLGPLPAVALIPFLPMFKLGESRDFSWVGHLYSLLNVWLFAVVLRRAGVQRERLAWALLLFFGGTFYFAQALVSNSWYFGHVIGTTCLLLAIAEALGRRRLMLVGLFLGLAGTARFTILFALPFFLWLIWRTDSRSDGEKVDGQRAEGRVAKPLQLAQRAGLLLLGLAVPVTALLLYNYLRFNNPLESGYGISTQNRLIPSLDEARRTYGLFSPVHAPKNLYFMLLQGPMAVPAREAAALQFPYIQPSSWGLGMFFAAPALLYAFRAKIREPLVQACWLAVICVMVPVVTHFAPGWVQFGPRYSLDFLPFVLLLAARGLPDPLTNFARGLILACVAINIWGAIYLMSWMFNVPVV